MQTEAVISLEYELRSERAAWCGQWMFSFARKCQLSFHSVCIILDSHHRCMRDQHFFFLLFFSFYFSSDFGCSLRENLCFLCTEDCEEIIPVYEVNTPRAVVIFGKAQRFTADAKTANPECLITYFKLCEV